VGELLHLFSQAPCRVPQRSYEYVMVMSATIDSASNVTYWGSRVCTVCPCTCTCTVVVLRGHRIYRTSASVKKTRLVYFYCISSIVHESFGGLSVVVAAVASCE
jgi:hypothetical protein